MSLVFSKPFETPADLGDNLTLWLDADDTDTITLNGSNVSTWVDKSPQGNNVTQAVEALQPAYSTADADWGGKNVVSFASDSLDLTSGVTGIWDINRYEAFVVYRMNNVSATQTAYTLGGALLNQWLHSQGIYNPGAGYKFFYAFNNNFGYGGTPLANTNYIQNMRYNGLGSTDATRAIGAIDGTVLSLTYPVPIPNTDGTITRISVGNQLAFNYLQGDIAEIIVLQQSLGDADRDKVMNYLRTKWGIA